MNPDGEDPDSYAQKYGSTKLQEYLATHEDNFIMYKTRVQLDAVKGDPIRRAELLKETAQTIALVADMMERQEYIRQCAYLLSVNEDALTSEVAKAINANRLKAYEQQTSPQQPSQPAPQQSAQPAVPEVPATPVPQESTLRPGKVDAREKHLVSLLLNYGNVRIPESAITGKKSEEDREFSIAQIIIGDLWNDELTFSDPRCQAIYEYFDREIAAGREVDPTIFIAFPDEAVKDFAIGLMVETWKISDSWWDKKKISVPTIEDNLRQDVRETLLSFKEKCVDDRIEENARRFREVSDDAELQRLLKEKYQLVVLRRQLGAALHRVIN